MYNIACQFFGVFQVTLDGEAITAFHSDKARALLAYLALEFQEHQRAELAALLWPDIANKHALTNLRTTLHRLRQTLNTAAPGAADHLLSVTRQTVQFNRETAQVDVLSFREFLGGTGVPMEDLDHLEAAVKLYRGELLSGFGVADAPPFEEWLLLRRELYHQQTVLAYRTLITAYEQDGRYKLGYALANRLLGLDPYSEEASRRMMRLLAHMGHADRALDQFEQLRKRLRIELGVDPSSESVALIEQIVAGEFVLTATLEEEPGGIAGGALVGDRQTMTRGQARDLLSDVPEPGVFFGRAEELQTITRWLVEEHSQVVAILGIGGMGKTTLAAQCIRSMIGNGDSPFDAVYWRSLVNAPPLGDLLPPLLQVLSQQQLTHIPENIDEQMRLLLGYLRTRRVLLVLDNMESLLEPGRAAAYRSGYEPYGQLIRQLATLEHQSHLVFTSREHSRDYHLLERDGHAVKSLSLVGLDNEASQQLLLQRGLLGDGDQQAMLVARYSGNPLALKLVADTVDEIFGGEIAEFLAEDTLIFDDIRLMLDQHFARLTDLGQEILYWLAIERETTSLATLRSNLLNLPVQRILLETLRSLRRRSLIERHEDGFGLQNLVTEYLTDRLVDQASSELHQGKLNLLKRFALQRAQAQDYLRQSQTRMILAPIAHRLTALLDVDRALVHRLLDGLRDEGLRVRSYAGGNLLNLLLHMGVDVTGYDFSRLCVWEANLQGAWLASVDFDQANLDRSAFTESIGMVWSVAYSPDGLLIAAGTAEGKIQLWRSATGQPVASWRGHVGGVYSVAFSPDGAMLASGGADSVIQIWDMSAISLLPTGVGVIQQWPEVWGDAVADSQVAIGGAGPILRTLRGHTAAVRQVVFGPVPDGQSTDGVLATASEDKTIRLWSTRAWETTQLLQGHVELIETVAISPDGRLLASGSRGVESDLRLWDARSGQLLRAAEQSEWTLAVAFDSGGHRLAVATGDGVVRLLDVALLLDADVDPSDHGVVLGRHDGNVDSVMFSPDGQALASGGSDRKICVWDIATEQLRLTLAGHKGWVRAVAFSPDGLSIASGSWDHSIRLWDSQSGVTLRTIYGGATSVFAVKFSPDGKRLVSATSDGIVRIWNVASGEITHNMHGHTDMGWRIAFSPDGTMIASSSFDGSVRLWDSLTGEARDRLTTYNAGTHGVDIAPNNRWLATSVLDGTVVLTDLAVLRGRENGLLHRQLKGHTNWCLSVAFSPDGQYLASSGADHLIILWDVPNGSILRILRGHKGGVQEIVFSPDGKRLASASWDETVRLWDVETGDLLHTLKGHTSLVRGVAFSPDGRTIASSSYDGAIRLWNADSGQGKQILTGHTGWVLYVTFSPDGGSLASGSADKSIRLWDPVSGECRHIWQLPGPYEGMNITGVTGITEAQRQSLKALGAVED